MVFRNGAPSDEEVIRGRVKEALRLTPAERLAAVTRVSSDMLVLSYRGVPPPLDRTRVVISSGDEQ